MHIDGVIRDKKVKKINNDDNKSKAVPEDESDTDNEKLLTNKKLREKKQKKKVKKLRDNLDIPLEKAKQIYEMAKEKKAYSKVCEEESSDDEMQMNPTMQAVVNNMRKRMADQV